MASTVFQVLWTRCWYMILAIEETMEILLNTRIVGPKITAIEISNYH